MCTDGLPSLESSFFAKRAITLIEKTMTIDEEGHKLDANLLKASLVP